MTSRDSIHGFALRLEDSSHEADAALHAAKETGVPVRRFRKATEVPAGWVAVGDVPWSEGVLGRTVTPDYYPSFLADLLHRRVWRQDEWPLGHRLFIKPADAHKRFTGFITSGTYRKKKRGPYWCSEPVVFTNEWRYYVADGQIMRAIGYAGAESLKFQAPKVSLALPAGWCGTIDLGSLDDGRVALVEAHPPYACGWYGEVSEGIEYATWLRAGWKWLVSNGVS